MKASARGIYRVTMRMGTQVVGSRSFRDQVTADAYRDWLLSFDDPLPHPEIKKVRGKRGMVRHIVRCAETKTPWFVVEVSKDGR